MTTPAARRSTHKGATIGVGHCKHIRQAAARVNQRRAMLEEVAVLVRQRVLQVVSSTLTVGASVRSWPLLLPRQSRLENQTYIGPRALRRQSETTTKPSMKATTPIPKSPSHELSYAEGPPDRGNITVFEPSGLQSAPPFTSSFELVRFCLFTRIHGQHVDVT